MDQPFYLIVHTDHPLDVKGPNSGAEMATLCQARFLALAGKKVVVCARLTGNETTCEGIEYWDLGDHYEVDVALTRASQRGQFYLISAGRALAVFLARNNPKCLYKLLVSHDRSAGDCGFRPGILGSLVDTIICVSHAQRDKLVSEGYPGEKTIVVYNGVNLDLFPFSPPERHNPTKLVFSGALVYDKGIHLLISAFTILKQKHPALTLDVYGSAGLWGRDNFFDPEKVSQAIPGISFYGKVSQEVLAYALGTAGICVVPSIWFDPFPLTSLEAQACGCPVVTFDVGGLKEGLLPGETGIVSEDISEQGLLNALHSLLSSPSRLTQMSKRASEHARTKFRWENVIDTFISLCELKTNKLF